MSDDQFILKLTAEQLIDIYNDAMSVTAGERGVRSHTAVKNCVDHPFLSVYGREKFITVFEKAAALFHAIITWHPFVDGNKRTALVAVYQFLKINGYTFSMPADFQQVILGLAAKEIVDEENDIPRLASWIEKHTKKDPSSFGSLKRKLS